MEIDLNEKYYEWKFKLKKKQREIVELWWTCFNVWRADGVKTSGRFKFSYDSNTERHLQLKEVY